MPSATWSVGECRRSGEPSTMSSCTSVPRCSSSTAAAPRTAAVRSPWRASSSTQAGTVARSRRRDRVRAHRRPARRTSRPRLGVGGRRRPAGKPRPPRGATIVVASARPVDAGLTADQGTRPRRLRPDGRPHPRPARPARRREPAADRRDARRRRPHLRAARRRRQPRRAPADRRRGRRPATGSCGGARRCSTRSSSPTASARPAARWRRSTRTSAKPRPTDALQTLKPAPRGRAPRRRGRRACRRRTARDSR